MDKTKSRTLVKTLGEEIDGVLPYPGVMNTPEPGIKVISDESLKEITSRLVNYRLDIALRKLGTNGSYVIELIARMTYTKQSCVAMLAHADSSALANEYLASIHDKVRKFTREASLNASLT